MGAQKRVSMPICESGQEGMIPKPRLNSEGQWDCAREGRNQVVRLTMGCWVGDINMLSNYSTGLASNHTELMKNEVALEDVLLYTWMSNILGYSALSWALVCLEIRSSLKSDKTGVKKCTIDSLYLAVQPKD